MSSVFPVSLALPSSICWKHSVNQSLQWCFANLPPLPAFGPSCIASISAISASFAWGNLPAPSINSPLSFLTTTPVPACQDSASTAPLRFSLITPLVGVCHLRSFCLRFVSIICLRSTLFSCSLINSFQAIWSFFKTSLRVGHAISENDRTTSFPDMPAEKMQSLLITAASAPSRSFFSLSQRSNHLSTNVNSSRATSNSNPPNHTQWQQ